MEQTFVFRESGIVTKYEHFASVLQQFGTQERLQKSYLRRSAALSQGQAHRVFRDAVLLGLLQNGDGLRITALGRQWAQETRESALPRRETMQRAAMNVPAYACLTREFANVADEDRIQALLCKFAPGAPSKDVGSATLRYLEAFHPQRASSGNAPPPTAAAEQQCDDEHLAGALAYSGLIQQYGREKIQQYHAFYFSQK